MYPIVNIIYSAPTMNTHSKKWSVPNLNPAQINMDDEAIDTHYFFALPNTMDKHDIVQVIQHNTNIYNLQDLNMEDIAEWREIKKNNVKKRQMKQIRERAELLVKLKRELRQTHKLSRMENGYKGICWWSLDYWGRDTISKKGGTNDTFT